MLIRRCPLTNTSSPNVNNNRRHTPDRPKYGASRREKTNCRAGQRVICLAAAQMAIATEAKRFVPEVLEARGSGVRLLCWTHGVSPSSGPQALRAQARTDAPASGNQEPPAGRCRSGRPAPTPARVSTHTVRKIREREAVAIAERKQRLVSIFGNVAEIAAERMEELAGRATLRDAGTTAGIATDKLLALLGETGEIPMQVNLQFNADLLHARYAALVAEISGTQSADSKETLPNREMLSGADAMGSQSGKENLQK